MKRLRQEDVLRAIQGSGGVISAIAKRLDVTWNTARTWCWKWEATKQALSDEENKILDLAESKIYESIQAGNTQDAKWLLATKGKSRGFSERHEMTAADGAPLTIRYEVVGDAKPDSDASG